MLVHQRRLICLVLRTQIWVLMLCGLLAVSARADSFQLNDGSTVTGDVVSGDETGLRLRLPDDSYSKPVPWTNFSQDDLKKLEQDPKFQRFKLDPFVSPYIVETEQEKRQKTDIGPLKDVPRLNRPAPGSLFGAMLSSPVGFFVLLVLYGAGIYAGYEVALFRRRPKGMVCGLAAIPVLGFLSPIIFLSMPTQRLAGYEEETDEAEGGAAAPPPPSPTFTVPGTPPSEPEHAAPAETGGLKLAHSAPASSGAALPPPQIFQRGAFMFNRRFFETKFPGFFGVARPSAEKDMVLLIKAARGEYIAERISRISANDCYVQVRKGHVTEEVMVPFTEIHEVQLKHKDSP